MKALVQQRGIVVVHATMWRLPNGRQPFPYLETLPALLTIAGGWSATRKEFGTPARSLTPLRA